MRKIAVLIALLCVVPFAAAGGEKREIAAAKERIHKLMEQAEELAADGQHEKAEKLRKKAHDLEAKLYAHMKERKKKPRSEADEMEEIIHGLQAGMKALRRLGRHGELVEHMERIAVDLKQELGQRERRKHRGKDEHAAARHQLKLMRIAMHALMEKERRDAAELMEHAIHAMELRLEGRRDKEARTIIERAPKPGQIAELLMLAQGILQELGQGEMAEHVGKLARQYAEHGKRVRREREPRRERDARRRERDDRPRGDRDADRGDDRPHRERDVDRLHAEHLERLMHRIEELEEHIRDLANAIERLQRRR